MNNYQQLTQDMQAEEGRQSASFKEGYQDKQDLRGLTHNLGIKLWSKFSDEKAFRQPVESRWLKDLRQFKGVYDPTVKIPAGRSRAFVRLTRIKVKTMDAKLTDMLFPDGEDRNWDIEPTPVPELPPEIMAQLKHELATINLQEAIQSGELQDEQQAALWVQMLQAGQVPPELEPSDDEIIAGVNDAAKAACDKMRTVIADELVEGKYKRDAKNVLHSGNLYGTGVLKGPVYSEEVKTCWVCVGQQTHAVQVKKVRPYWEYVPVWSIYPDQSVTHVDQCSYIFQRHCFNRSDLRQLADRDDFHGDVINEHIKSNPDGDADVESYENELLLISGGEQDQPDNTPTKQGKYEIVEFHGMIDGLDLQEIGADVPEDRLDAMVEAEVWMLKGGTIIKAEMSPIETGKRPYHFHYFEKDDSSIWGEGIPAIMRDPQRLFNGAIRAMMDNLSVTAGPMLEINTRLLHPGQDLTSIKAFKVYLRNDVGETNRWPAVRSIEVNAYVQELMAVAQMFKTFADEVTVPSYMHGETDGGVGNTVGGLSMLMSAANITIKDVVRHFDQGITEPFIGQLYDWNMQFSEREDIKGDYKVRARGSSALLAKELKSQRLEMFAAGTLNPRDSAWVKPHDLNVERAKALELPASMIYTEDEMEQQQQAEQAMMQQEARAGGEQGGGVPVG